MFISTKFIWGHSRLKKKKKLEIFLFLEFTFKGKDTNNTRRKTGLWEYTRQCEEKKKKGKDHKQDLQI